MSVVQQDLLMWVNAKLAPSNITISNFSNDWKDGTALCALAAALNPKCVNIVEIKEKSASDEGKKQNVITGLVEIEKRMGDLPELKVEDILVKRPDDKSIMTYLGVIRQKDLAPDWMGERKKAISEEEEEEREREREREREKEEKEKEREREVEREKKIKIQKEEEEKKLEEEKEIKRKEREREIEEEKMREKEREREREEEEKN